MSSARAFLPLFADFEDSLESMNALVADNKEDDAEEAIIAED